MTEIRLNIELRTPKPGLGRFRCAAMTCRAILMHADQIGVLVVGTDEILLCPSCTRKLVVTAGPKDRPSETLLLDDEGRELQRRIYAGLHQLICRRYRGFSLVECDDGAVQVNAANADLSARIELHLWAAGVEVKRTNPLRLAVWSEEGLAEPLRPAIVIASARQRGAQTSCKPNGE